MSGPKHLALDANILVRAVFGVRVFRLLETYEATATFYIADACIEDARRYVPEVAKKRGVDAAGSMSLLERILLMIETVDLNLYEVYEIPARERISSRDADDWPVVATALLLNCPIWTEDQDFFGSGVATWTTQNVELYLRND